MIPATITTEVLEHADGRRIAYIDATAVAVFAYQEPDGTHVIDICTRQGIPPGKLRLILDGVLMNSVSSDSAAMPSKPDRDNSICGERLALA